MAELEKIILTRVSWARFPFEIQAFFPFLLLENLFKFCYKNSVLNTILIITYHHILTVFLVMGKWQSFHAEFVKPLFSNF